MVLPILYLKSYDRFDEVLRYEVANGSFAIISRVHFGALATPFSFGAFTCDDGRVVGVFASPDGPVLFVDSVQITARFGSTHAAVISDPACQRQQFTLTHNGPEGETVLTVQYRERYGLGANPYDTELEDIDLFALLASGLRNQEFFGAYTTEW